MASPSEIILPIGTQKHDPAWKHCLMIRSGDRTLLKCKYCTKQFFGGGIHRIKEHLARQKGNASCCAKVPQEVQATMLQSLESALARKKRRVRLAEEMRKLTSMDSHELDSQVRLSDVGLGAGIDMSFAHMDIPDEGTKSRRGRKRKRPKVDTGVPQDSISLAVAPVEDAIASMKPSSSLSINNDRVCLAIGRFLYDVGAPEAVNSVYFQPMLDAIATAAGGKTLGDLSYHAFRGQILERTLEEVNSHIAFCRSSWADTGCSLLADEWVSENGRTMINFFVYCPKGTVFLKSVDATDTLTSSDTLYELLMHTVEEVGNQNVVQVVTKSSDIHALAGKRLTEAFPTLFWSPCAFQCIDGMLEDIGKIDAISEVLENAKIITRFIYNSAFALNLVRTFTQGKDLIACAETPNALNFATLKTMHGFKEELKAMIQSEEWSGSSLSKLSGGIAVSDTMNSLTFWSNCALVLQIVEPLVRLHKLVCSAKRPAMGYLYVGLYQAKETIRKVLVDKTQYMQYWEIIDRRWNKELAQPLHAAGFFLNPLFFEAIAIKSDVSNEIFSGMLDCIERLVPDLEKQDKIQEELNIYRSEAAANFRRPMAIRTRRTLIPANWWLTHGQICPNLMQLAVRILSQTCSAKGCDRSFIPFEQMYKQQINLLEHQRLEDLTFVHYNLKLQHRQQVKSEDFDPISISHINTVADWVVERDAIPSDPQKWKDLIQPVTTPYPLIANEDDVEAFISGLDEELIKDAARCTVDLVDAKLED